MKKFTKVISVVLCALLAVSVFTVGVSAKKAKKYVKSIKVTKKATITLGVKQKTVTKSYKVTVKVKGKASKKFTAKSSKASVASVKVSGSKIKVTAKKAGKATITVTSKGKNSKGKKVKAKLVVTVKAPSVADYRKAVADYISKNCKSYNGNKTYTDKEDDLSLYIINDKSNKALKFIYKREATEDKYAATFSFDLKLDNSKNVKFNYEANDNGKSIKGTATCDISKFDYSEDYLPFKMSSTGENNFTLDDAQMFAGSGFLSIDLTLYKELGGYELSDLGFEKVN